jgi:hypothetical protein
MPIANDGFDRHLKLMEQLFTPLKNEIVDNIAGAMVLIERERERTAPLPGSIEQICSLEWSIGGPARITGVVSGFAAGKK